MDKSDALKHIFDSIMMGSCSVKYGELHLTCPFCGDDRDHFSVNVKKALYHCFKCKSGGSLSKVIYQHPDQWVRICKLISVRPTVTSKNNEVPLKDLVLLESFNKEWETGTPQNYSLMGSLARKMINYCLCRGMTYHQITTYRLMIKAFENRVYFPYWQGNKILHVMERNLSGCGPKTMDMDGAVKPLYGRQVRKLKEVVVLVEGVFDHFVTPNSYAMLGSVITDDQISSLKQDGISKVIIINDPDAMQSANSNKDKLARRRLVASIVVLPNRKDPAELGGQIMSQIIQELMSEQFSDISPLYVHL